MSSLQPTLANERIGVLITIAVCAAQMVFSHLWLHVFRMSPFEWLEKRYVSVVAAYCKENKSLDAYWR